MDLYLPLGRYPLRFARIGKTYNSLDTLWEEIVKRMPFLKIDLLYLGWGGEVGGSC